MFPRKEVAEAFLQFRAASGTGIETSVLQSLQTLLTSRWAARAQS